MPAERFLAPGEAATDGCPASLLLLTGAAANALRPAASSLGLEPHGDGFIVEYSTVKGSIATPLPPSLAALAP